MAPTTSLVAADVNGNAKQWANWSGDCNVNPSGGTPSLGDFGAIVDQFGCPWGVHGWFSYTVGFKPASLTPPVTYTDQAIDSTVPWPSYNALVANPTAARVKDWVLDQLQEHPEDYDELLPWLNWVPTSWRRPNMEMTRCGTAAAWTPRAEPFTWMPTQASWSSLGHPATS